MQPDVLAVVYRPAAVGQPGDSYGTSASTLAVGPALEQNINQVIPSTVLSFDATRSILVVFFGEFVWVLRGEGSPG
jgi:hypothetical protein